MSKMQGALIGMATVVLGVSVIAQQNVPTPPAPRPADYPEWAYVPSTNPGPASALPTDDNAVLRIPGTTKTMKRGALRELTEVPDWYPEDRVGTVPPVVKHGRADLHACGFCHLADGAGRPDTGSLAGLHPVYFLQQMQDWEKRLRGSAGPRKITPIPNDAGKATPEELRTIAEFFARQPYPRRLKVVESRTAPKVRLHGVTRMAIPAAEGGGMEPLGDKIVEVPDDNLRAEAYDTRLGWTAYVPPGTLNRGKEVAAKYQCATCHGPNLEGRGPVPPLAGRSPSYAMRQLFDMKQGIRHGPWAELMKPVVNGMSVPEMMAVSAFAGSLAPPLVPGAPGTR